MNSASLCSLAGRYENPIPPRCLTPMAIDFLKIPAQLLSRENQDKRLKIIVFYAQRRLLIPFPLPLGAAKAGRNHMNK